MKRICVACLCVMMVACSGIMCWAESGHTFQAYEIITDGGEWGNNVNGSSLENALREDLGNFDDYFDDSADASYVFSLLENAEAGGSWFSTGGMYKTFARICYSCLTGDPISLDSLGSGYYLICDTTATLGEGEAYPLAVLTKGDGGNVRPKGDGGKLSIAVKSDQDVGEVGKTRECFVGDKLDFVITIGLPSNLGDYHRYNMEIRSAVCEGLTYDTDEHGALKAVVKLDGNVITSNFDWALEGVGSDRAYVARLTDVVKSINAGPEHHVQPGSVITIEYQAVVNDKIAERNLCPAQLIYSADPNEVEPVRTGTTSDVVTLTHTAATGGAGGTDGAGGTGDVVGAGGPDTADHNELLVYLVLMCAAGAGLYATFREQSS